MKTIPYWTLSAFYFLYFLAVSAIGPYWPSYLHFRGFSASQIGVLLAVTQVVRLFAPNLWAEVVARSGSHARVIKLACWLSAVAFCGYWWADGLLLFGIVTALYSLPWHGALPQCEALTLSYLRDRANEYSRIRLWGSIGFVVGVLALGRLIESVAAPSIPIFIAVTLFMCAIASQFLRDPIQETVADRTHVTIWPVLRQPAVMAFFVACFLMQASHGAYNGFFTLYLQRHGYDPTAISIFWVVGVIGEIVIFIVLPRLLKRVAPGPLWIAAMFITAARWLALVYWVESPLALFGLQSLHAASFGLFHAIAVKQVGVWFSGNSQARGQALFSAIAYGAGGGLGSLTSGFIWDHVAPEAIYQSSAVMAGLAGVFAWRAFRHAEAIIPFLNQK